MTLRDTKTRFKKKKKRRKGEREQDDTGYGAGGRGQGRASVLTGGLLPRSKGRFWDGSPEKNLEAAGKCDF